MTSGIEIKVIASNAVKAAFGDFIPSRLGKIWMRL